MALRHALSILALAGAALLTQSCVSILGLDEKNTDAVDRLCLCQTAQEVTGNSKVACVADVGHRLEVATTDTRAHWMDYFTTHFSSCDHALECLGQRPTCRQIDEKCKADSSGAECCTKHCGAGKCIN